jgi:hypothetical protein
MRKTSIHIIQWTLAHPCAASAELLDLSASAVHVGPAVVALVRHHSCHSVLLRTSSGVNRKACFAIHSPAGAKVTESQPASARGGTRPD